MHHGEDLPGRFGIIPWTPDEHALAVGTARYVGDGVAAVAAIDERTADIASRLVRVEYERLPAATTLDAAITRPELGLGDSRRDNVSKTVELAFGDVDGACERAHVVVRDTYFFEGSAHAPIETHVAIAQFDGAGLLTVWSSTQVPHYLPASSLECSAYPPHVSASSSRRWAERSGGRASRSGAKS